MHYRAWTGYKSVSSLLLTQHMNDESKAERWSEEREATILLPMLHILCLVLTREKERLVQECKSIHSRNAEYRIQACQKSTVKVLRFSIKGHITSIHENIFEGWSKAKVPETNGQEVAKLRNGWDVRRSYFPTLSTLAPRTLLAQYDKRPW